MQLHVIRGHTFRPRQTSGSQLISRKSTYNRPTDTHVVFIWVRSLGGCLYTILTCFRAPTLGPRSPPKATSARERPKSATDHDDAQLTTRPEKWSVKDTSVNIASAFHQAASDMSSTNHNAAWASGSTRTSTVPRSTSVDYETVAPAARRFPAPPKRLGSSTAVPGRGLTKSVSATIVPDSEGEDSQQPTRGKTPLRNMVENVAAYYVRQRSQDPPEHLNNISGSFEYSQEERDFQDQKRKGNHKRGGISADNKAYKPSMSDLEDDDEDFADDDNGRKRRAKKKEVGRVSNLPTIGETRRRKKKPKTPKAAGQPESADEEEEDVRMSFQHCSAMLITQAATICAWLSSQLRCAPAIISSNLQPS